MCLRVMFTSVLVLEFVFITFRGSFQQCASEIVNHLQPDRTDSTAISSKCQIRFKWIDRSLDVMMYLSIFTLLTL